VHDERAERDRHAVARRLELEGQAQSFVVNRQLPSVRVVVWRGVGWLTLLVFVAVSVRAVLPM
jgi:hypothetical protein